LQHGLAKNAKMTPSQFHLNSLAILGTSLGWQTKIARLLNVNQSTVRKWLKSGEIPQWVEEKFAAITAKSDPSLWPRDEWLIGTAFNVQEQAREYIVHLQYPRFVARIVAVSDGDRPIDDEQLVNLQSGVVYGVNQETLLCEINFIDHLDTAAARQWLEAAVNEIERVDEIESRIASGQN